MKLDNVDSQEGEKRSVRINRLREEIGRIIEREYALLVKYHEFAASFEAIMPDEKLRHDAALQALSTTMKLSQQEVVEAFDRQQKELAILEQEVVELFADVRTSIIVGNQGREGLRVESAVPALAASQRIASHKNCPKCGERITFVGKENRWRCYSCAYEELLEESACAEQKQESSDASPAFVATEWQKKCPICGGQLNYHAQDARWLCYSCAHEELPAHEVQGKNEGKRDQAKTLRASAPSFAVPLAAMVVDASGKSKKGTSLSASQLSNRKKTCPVCNKKMDWHQLEKIWRCFFCDHKTRY